MEMSRLHGSGTCKPASRGCPLLWACSQGNVRMEGACRVEAQSGTRDGLMAQNLYHNMGARGPGGIMQRESSCATSQAGRPPHSFQN